jgi:hypothetical protein
VTVGAVVVGVAALVVFALLPNRGAPTPKPGVTGEPGAGQASPRESDRSRVRTSKLS